MSTNNLTVFDVENGTSGARCQLNAGIQSLQKGQWYYVAGVFDGAQACQYLNGYGACQPISLSGSINYATGALYIGAYNKGLGYFNGLIDEVRVSNIALSPSWLYASYLSETNSFITYSAEEKSSNAPTGVTQKTPTVSTTTSTRNPPGSPTVSTPAPTHNPPKSLAHLSIISIFELVVTALLFVAGIALLVVGIKRISKDKGIYIILISVIIFIITIVMLVYLIAPSIS